MDVKYFLYTDNQTAEGAYGKGSAKSRALFELIVMLYKLQMEFDFILHVIWIAGTICISLFSVRSATLETSKVGP
jgi:hypothetical protein